MSETVTISRATIDDAEEILALIKRAFAPVADVYRDPEFPPLIESLASHRACYEARTVLKAVDETGRIVGTVQGEPREDACYVARLAVEPAWQRRGVARALAAALEDAFPDAQRFELFTGHLSEGTLALYRSLGYRETQREEVDERLTVVWMEKRR
jgi:ribosomal protein S18 acetylase RimI-like enzyme